MTRGPVRTPAIESVFSRRRNWNCCHRYLTGSSIAAESAGRMLAPGPTNPVADRLAHTAVLPSRSAPSIAIVTSWPSTSPFGSDGACGMSTEVSFGASATSPVTTLQRSLTGVMSDNRSGLLLSRTSRSFGRSVDSFETSLARAFRNVCNWVTAASSSPTAFRFVSSASGSETMPSKRSTTRRRNPTMAPSSGSVEPVTRHFPEPRHTVLPFQRGTPAFSCQQMLRGNAILSRLNRGGHRAWCAACASGYSAAWFQPLKLVGNCRRWPSCARRVEGAGDLACNPDRILDGRLPLAVSRSRSDRPSMLGITK